MIHACQLMIDHEHNQLARDRGSGASELEVCVCVASVEAVS